MATTDHEQTPLVGHDVPRAQRILTLEFGSRDDFADPSLEYRRLFSELLGTFMLVLVAAGGGLLHAKGEISLAAAVVAPGLMVMAIILFMGAVSGAHLNQKGPKQNPGTQRERFRHPGSSCHKPPRGQGESHRGDHPP